MFNDGTIWDVNIIKEKVLEASDNNDVIRGYSSNDQLYGLKGNDQLYGGLGDDTLEGGEGNDHLEGGEGNDSYIFAPSFGHDIINNYDSSSNRQDIIEFIGGLTQKDFSFRRVGNDLIIKTLDEQNSIEVNNYFLSDAAGHYRIDQIKFSDNTILDVEAVKALVLIGTEASEILQAYASGSTISAEAGDDTLQGNVGNDQLYGGAGADTLHGDSGDDHLEGGLDADKLYGQNGADVLKGDAGDDQLYGGSGDDTLEGGEGSDTLEGSTGNDYLEGNEGIDQLYGGEGDDILDGGAGNDRLRGDVGNDIYRFNLGWGSDVIEYQYNNSNDKDAIEFVGIDANDLILRKVGSDMLITHRITGDQITVQSQFPSYDYGDKPIHFIRFDNQVEWDLDDFNVQAVKGTELNDVIQGTTSHDVIHAGAGDDVITGTQFYAEHPETQYFVYGEAGNDQITGLGYLDGGTGNDEIHGKGHLLGGDGDDLISGEGILEGQAGNDTLTGQGQLYGGEGQDNLILDALGYENAGSLSGGGGNDTLTVAVNRRQFVDENNKSGFTQNEDGYLVIQNNGITEAQRAVYIEGGKGNDTIYGSFGDEIYLFNLGDGQDILVERAANENYTNVATSFDVLRLGAGITTTEISLHRHGTDLIVQHSNGTDQVTIKNYFNGGHFKINEIQFADETVWDTTYIENHVIYHGTANADEVWGYRSANETFELGEGNDKAYANAGNDIMYGQAGNDTLWGQEGNDQLFGGIGDDYLDGGLGDDSVYGGAGNDVVAGGKGTDLLDGGIGDDKYYWYLADGKDIIDQTGGGTDVLWIMDNGVTRDRISFKQEANDLIITVDNNVEQSVRVKDHFLGGEKAISTVQANNQVGISAIEIAGIIKAQSYNGLYDIVKEGGSADDTIYGTSGKDLIQSLDGNDKIWAGNGNDQLEGGAGDDYLDGQAGDDRVYGGAGNDTLLGGTGIDTLDGGAGNDKYYWYLADGKDVIDQTGGGTDTLWIMDTGVSADRIQFSKEGNDLLVKVDNNAEQTVRVKDHFLGGVKAIASVQANGQVAITAAQIAQKVLGETTPTQPTTNMITGTDNAETLYGTTKDDVIRGLSGDDQIWAQDGNDRIEGGAGNDYLAGQGGNDQIYGGIGNDTLVGGLGLDTLDGGAGDDKYYWYLADGKDIIDQTGGGHDVLWIMDTGVTADRIQFSQEANDLIVMVDNNSEQSVRVKDHFLGGDKAIVSVQANGQVAITAAQIAQKIATNTPVEPTNPIQPSTGAPTVNIADYSNVKTGTANAETLNGGTGRDHIQTLGSDDKVWTFAGNDYIDGGEGADYLDAGDGDDIIVGGAGIDTLVGGIGNDQIYGGSGDDKYYYYLGHGKDTLYTGGGNDTLWLMDSGITEDRINFTKDENDLIITLDNNTAQTVRVKDHFLGGDHALAKVQPNGGYTITAAQIQSKIDAQAYAGYDNVIKGTTAGETLYGTAKNDVIQLSEGDDKTWAQAGNDRIEGGAGNDYLDGGAGNDLIFGGMGNDTLLGGLGLDLLDGGAGDDSYYYYLQDGLDTIDQTSGGNDTLWLMDKGITEDRILFAQEGNDLYVVIDQNINQVVKVKDHFSGGDKAIDQVVPNGGYTISSAKITQLVKPLNTYEDIYQSLF